MVQGVPFEIYFYLKDYAPLLLLTLREEASKKSVCVCEICHVAPDSDYRLL